MAKYMLMQPTAGCQLTVIEDR